MKMILGTITQHFKSYLQFTKVTKYGHLGLAVLHAKTNEFYCNCFAKMFKLINDELRHDYYDILEKSHDLWKSIFH